MSKDEQAMDVIGEVIRELERATKKFPTWPTDPLHALAVLGEEYGELTKAALQLTYEPEKVTHEELQKEAVQVAAMALRFAASLDVYVYTKAEQHRQEQFEDERRAYSASGGLHP